MSLDCWVKIVLKKTGVYVRHVSVALWVKVTRLKVEKSNSLCFWKVYLKDIEHVFKFNKTIISNVIHIILYGKRRRLIIFISVD